MTYEQLRKYAEPHIRKGAELPTNAYILLHQLHIPFKDQEQCEKDYGGKMTPLYNHPAFLAIRNNEKVIYYKTTAQYWRFYLFHEIAHYLLEHETDSPQHERDANMLACILIAPIENLPSTLKSARDLSCTCSIPIDMAEEYWDVIRDDLFKKHKKKPIKTKRMAIAGATLVLFLLVGTFLFHHIVPKKQTEAADIPNPTSDVTSNAAPIGTETINSQESGYYMTSSGTHYHLQDCQYIKDKSNIIYISLEEAESLKLEPCKKCIQ